MNYTQGITVSKTLPKTKNKYTIITPVFTNSLKHLDYKEKDWASAYKYSGEQDLKFVKAGYLKIDLKKIYNVSDELIEITGNLSKLNQSNIGFVKKLTLLYQYIDEYIKQKNFNQAFTFRIYKKCDSPKIVFKTDDEFKHFSIEYNGKTEKDFGTLKEAFKYILEQIKPEIKSYLNSEIIYTDWVEIYNPLYKKEYSRVNYFDDDIKVKINEVLSFLPDSFYNKEFKFKTITITNTKRWHNGSDHWLTYEDEGHETIIAKDEATARKLFDDKMKERRGVRNSGLMRYTIPYSQYVKVKISELKSEIKAQQEKLKKLEKDAADDLMID